jgi:RNA polymerase sigma-70 factor (ECF subfamily)
VSNEFYTTSILPYSGIIIKICRAYSNSQEDFEDYYQEVCLQIWRSRKNFKGNSEWSTWIYRLSLNVCLTLLKKDKKRNEQYFVSDAFPANLIQDYQVFLDEDLQQLYNGIKLLTEIDRAIILLYLEERPYKEIAKIIGTNTNNIGVKIKRIKERLKIILTK